MKNEKINTDGVKRTILDRPRPVGRIVEKSPNSNTIRPDMHSGRKVIKNMDITRSGSISHFSAHPKTVSPTQKPATPTKHLDIGPAKHPMTKNISDQKPIAVQRPQAQMPINTISLKEQKEIAIAKASEKMETPQKDCIKNHKCKSKLAKIVMIALAILLIASYLVYINLPNISINMASAQAGVNAKYPEYNPEGYRRNDTVNYKDGQVTIDFISTSGKNKFSIIQEKSSWDSTAVKNKVNADSKGEFITTQDGGLTIFSFGSNASWVNGGVLYTIIGDAQLSCDQIRRIANSL